MTDQELTALKKKFGKNLKRIRESKSMSLLDVSYNCTIDESHISKIEQGKFNISLKTIAELAKGLDIHPSKLMEY
jgi:transcriptional regulator with XRE-family HTH domain